MNTAVNRFTNLGILHWYNLSTYVLLLNWKYINYIIIYVLHTVSQPLCCVLHLKFIILNNTTCAYMQILEDRIDSWYISRIIIRSPTFFIDHLQSSDSLLNFIRDKNTLIWIWFVLIYYQISDGYRVHVIRFLQREKRSNRSYSFSFYVHNTYSHDIILYSVSE